MSEPNKRLGDYEISKVLGSGGMGRVYQVRNTITDRVEAMKVLLPDLEGHEDVAARFQREIKVLAALNHPNIAAIYGLEETDPSAFVFENAAISWRDRRMSVDQLTKARKEFAIAFGSCSFREPVDELAQLTRQARAINK